MSLTMCCRVYAAHVDAHVVDDTIFFCTFQFATEEAANVLPRSWELVSAPTRLRLARNGRSGSGSRR